MEEGMVTKARDTKTLPWSWKKGTLLEKFLICAIGLMIIIVTSATVVSRAQSLQKLIEDKNLPKSKAAICNTMPCLKVACRLKDNMNLTADPCVDFHQYACGGWVKQHFKPYTVYTSPLVSEIPNAVAQSLKSILETESTLDDLKAFNKTRTYYKSCLTKIEEEQGTAAVKTVLDEIGPIYDNDVEWINTKTNLTTVSYNILIRGGTPLFEIGYEIQSRNLSKTAVSISVPKHQKLIASQGLWKSPANGDDGHQLDPDSGYNNQTSPATNETANVTIDGQYLYNMLQEQIDKRNNDKMYTMLRQYFGRSENDSQQLRLEEELGTFISSVKKLIPLPKVLSQAKFNDETDINYSVRELGDLFTHVNWKQLLQMLFDRPFSDNDVVQISYPPYFKGLQKLISDTNPRIVHNAALALYARDVLSEVISYNETDRWEFCISVTKLLFPIPLSAMHVKSFSTEYLKELEHDAVDLLNNLKKSFRNIINHNEWLDSTSKESLQRKLSSMTKTFISSKILYNDSFVEQSVEQIDVTVDNFIADTLSAYIKARLDYYRMNTKDENIIEKEIAEMLKPFDVNAFHIVTLNSINVPIGILLPPNYNLGQPKYITYGGFGSTLAHEISHGYDAAGINHDESGEKRHWLTNQTVAGFKERTRCFVDLYSKQEKVVPFGGQDVVLHVDGNQTLTENLADNVGSKSAYQAYKGWVRRHEEEPVLPAFNLSADQLFFVSQAQAFCGTLSPIGYVFFLEGSGHTPDHERINGLIMNSKEFAEAFQCPIGSPMNPATKCDMW